MKPANMTPAEQLEALGFYAPDPFPTANIMGVQELITTLLLQDLPAADALLAAVDTDRATLQALVILEGPSANYRDVLPSWEGYWQRCRARCEALGDDPNRLFSARNDSPESLARGKQSLELIGALCGIFKGKPI